MICNKVIACSQHGISAIKRHAQNKSHIEACKSKRGSNGIIKSIPQARINASDGTLCNQLLNSHASSVTQAETLFTVALASDNVPYAFADTGTKIFPKMFHDSQVARDFNCKRSKVSYIISDGLGPYLKEQLITDIIANDCFYSIQIDETPIPEKRVQQMDVLVRYFSVKQGRVVVQHLQSYHLGHATAADLFDAVKDSLTELPLPKFLSFFSDGPNVMKSLKNKLKELNPSILDVGFCSLHTVHNAFACGLNEFGGDVESLAIDLYYFFKRSAVQSEDLKKLQLELGLADHVFLRHVNSRWLTLQSSLDRIIEQFSALKAFFKKTTNSRTESERLNRLKAAFASNKLLSTMLFLRNVAEIFNRFLLLFQKDEPLVHILYDEMVLLIKKLMGRFMESKSFQDKDGIQLKSVDVDAAALNWKQNVEIGSDTREQMASASVSDKSKIRLGARSFYRACTKYLIKKLPLENKLLQHLKILQPSNRQSDGAVNSVRALASMIPSVISPQNVSALTDEWIMLQAETLQPVSLPLSPKHDDELDESDDPELQQDQPNPSSHVRIDHYWAIIFALKDPSGNLKYKWLPVVVKALLCLAHGNAECERGFSENKHLLESRNRLNIESINGLRKIKSHIECIGSIDKFTITIPMLKAVQKSRKVYRERLEVSRSKAKKRVIESEVMCSKKRLKQEESEIQIKLNSYQHMLKNAEATITNGLKKKSIPDIESGNVLLGEARSKIDTLLIELEKNKNEQMQLASAKKNC